MSATLTSARSASDGGATLRLIYLRGSKELIRQRMQSRENHFMPTALLDSQFASLEEPTNAIFAEIDDPVPVIAEKVQS